MEVYILLTNTGTLLTKMIKMYTRQPLNHVSISFDHQLSEVYSFGRKRQINPFIGGFVTENMHSLLFEKADCALYKCSVSELDYWRMIRRVHQIRIHQAEYKYNFIGLFGVLLNKKINRKKAFFCSQFVASVLHAGGVLVTHKPEMLITPSDMRDSDQFHLVYEGSLSAYLRITTVPSMVAENEV